MRFVSLFAGIGGMDLGLERAGWECVGQVEIDEFCQRVLAAHWPKVPRFTDVRDITGEFVREQCGKVNALVGGPPCQPSSNAGKRLGSADNRWLWPDFLRLVSEVQPMWVLAENPRGVLSLEIEGMQFQQWIADQFDSLGYSLLPILLAAEDLGAPHKRQRVWFVGRLANTGSNGLPLAAMHGEVYGAREGTEAKSSFMVAWPERPSQVRAIPAETDGLSSDVAGWLKPRLTAIGNAVVPQCAEAIGRAILAF